MAMDLVMASIGENTRYGLGKERHKNWDSWYPFCHRLVSVLFLASLTH